MGFVDGYLQQVQRKELVDLEDLTTEFLFALNLLAHLFRRCDDDVVAGGPRTKCIVPGADAANRSARHPNPRPVNLAQVGALFLRPGPRAILVEFDVSAGGNSQVEVKLSMEIFQVAMAIDEAWENRLASDVNHLCIGRDRDFATTTDG